MDLTPVALTIGKLAALASVTPNAFRFYERVGLVPEPIKSRGGYRLFGPEALGLIQFIKHAQSSGLKLAEIRALLELQPRSTGCCDEVRRRLLAKRAELQSRIRALEEMTCALDYSISECARSSQTAEPCPLLSKLDECSSP